LTHNGIDIDQFILLAVYPTVAFFALGLIANKMRLREPLKYGLQALSCASFSIIYFITIPNGGAQGIATVLAMFAGILFLMARNYIIHPPKKEEQEENQQQQHQHQQDKTESQNSTSTNTSNI
jgi:predicted permease